MTTENQPEAPALASFAALDLLQVKSKLDSLNITFQTLYDYQLTRDEETALLKLFADNHELTVRQLLFGVILLLAEISDPSQEEIVNAIARVVIVYSPERFKDGTWWQTISALKQFDALTSSGRVN